MIYIVKMYIMEHVMIVSKWGNSLAVRLPKQLVEKLNLKEGDDIALEAADHGALRLQQNNARSLAISRMATRGWTLPKDWIFDRDEANRR